jgi:hypothetical protein
LPTSAASPAPYGEKTEAVRHAETHAAIRDLPTRRGGEATILELADADRLAYQRLAQEDLRAAPFDAAILPHPPHLVRTSIIGLAPSRVG